MRGKILKLIHEMRASYWFVPSVMVLAAIALAFITDRIDTILDGSQLAKIPWLYQNQPEGARAVLAAIATSMIGVAGVTFSMTLVTVSFAASNIGPRLIRNFMKDTGNQVTLGTFIATFVYCLLVLRTITNATGANDVAYVPNFSLLVALGMALLSVGNLIYFIHHIPESINVSRIANVIAGELQSSIKSLFPEGVGSEGDIETAPPIDIGAKFRVESMPVRLHETGYMQMVDDEALLEIAQQHDLIVRVQYRPGDFAQANSVLLYANPSARVNDDLASELRSCFVFGSRRTATQNSMFLINQLVEIMMRALSPGVNDPFTAVSCLDWLQAALAIPLRRRAPDFCRYDSDGNLRIVVHPVSFQRLAAAVFDQPLQYVASDRTAALRMMQAIAELVAICERADYRQILLSHAHRLNAAGQQCLPVASDQEELSSRCEQTLRLAEDPALRRSLRDDQGWLGGSG